MAQSPTSFKLGRCKTGGRQRGTPNRASVDVREAARQLIEDRTYRAALRRRLIAGTAPEMEKHLWLYAYGKPVDRVQVAVAPAATEVDLSSLTDEEMATFSRLY